MGGEPRSPPGIIQLSAIIRGELSDVIMDMIHSSVDRNTGGIGRPTMNAVEVARAPRLQLTQTPQAKPKKREGWLGGLF